MSQSKILIVENESIVAMDIKQRLIAMDFEVTATVSNGAAAIEQITNNKPDLILMDIQINGDIDGVKTATRIQEQFYIPVVYLTANSDTGSIERGKNTMPLDFLLKPFEDRDIRATVEIALLRHKLECELKRSEQAMKESEIRYRSLTDDVLNSTNTGLIILDADFKIVWLNQYIELYFGLRREDVIGKDKRQLICENIQYIFEDSDTFRSKVLATYDDNTYIENFVCHVLPDGERKNRWLEHKSHPIRTGLYTGGRAELYVDITERKQAERLHELARFPDENPGPIMRVSGEGVLVYANRASWQLLKLWNCKVNESLPDNWKKFVESALVKQEITEITVRAEGRTYSLVFSPFTSSGYVNIYGNDISKLKKIEENERKLQIELINAERIKSLGLLAGGVAHDLNNMLGPLVGYPELILRKLPDDSPFRDQIKKIGNSARDAASVIQDLLTLARRGRYEMVVTDLNEVITEYLDSPGFEKIKEENPEINFVIDLESEKQLIKGSSPHLAKVVMNLVVNAVDAMSGNGTLTINTKTQELDKLFSGYSSINTCEYVVFKVQDTGCGIESEDIKKIFEPYYSKKTMQGSRGSGLGLSVVYGILQDHGGYYDVFSEVGKGTEFVLYFPLTTESQEFKDVSEVLPEGNETILVVDDDEGQRELIQQVLTTFGYEVTMAKNGTEAVKIIESQSFDLVVLDMIMEPGFDGLDTYKRILEISPGQKAIIVSGFSALRRLEEALKLGVGQLVKKPFELKHLATAVRSELDKQEAGATA